ncbi:hypothetical protein ACQ4LE_003583 [Meloidogyne hapla]
MIYLIILLKIFLIIFLTKACNELTITTKRTLTKSIGSLELNSVEHNRWGSIFVGNPAKEFQLLFQLNSTDFWLINENANLGWKEQGRTKQRYNKNKSNSSKLIKEYFKEGNIKGILFEDKIEIGNIKIQKVPFVSAISGFPNYLQFLEEIDGVFGLSPLKTDKSILNLIINELNKPIITLYTRGVISGDPGDISVAIGSVTLGSENEKDCASGSYKYAKLSGNANEWATDLISIKIGNYKINVTNSNTNNIPKLHIVDNALYMYAPKAKLDEIANNLGVLNISKNVSDFYLLPLEKCQQEYKMPKIVLNVKNLKNKIIKVIIKPKQYMELYEEEHGNEVITETCRLLFLPNEGKKGFNNNDWNMGELFMLNRCISVNFAESTIGFGDKLENLDDKIKEIEDNI